MLAPSSNTFAAVSVVIPNWNLRADLAECIDSLLSSQYPNLSILVVDNASTDGSADYIAMRYPTVQVIRLTKNHGYAGALNAGIEIAREQPAEFILALNNDTIVPPEAIGRLVRLMEKEPAIGIAAPKVLYADDPQVIFSLGDRRFRYLPLPVGYGYKKKDGPRYKNVMEFDYVTGCAMLIRTGLIDQIGPFDSSLFMYYEDADFCRRARDTGWKIVCDGDTTILHKAQLSSKNDRAGTLRVRTRNRVWFYRRYPHGPSFGFTYSVLWIIAIGKLAGYYLRGKTELARSYWEGFLQGWSQPVPSVTFSWQNETGL